MNKLDGMPQQLGGILKSQFLADVGPVRLDRLDTQVQFRSDLVSLVAPADQSKDFQFTICQHVDSREVAFVSVPHESVQESGNHVVTHGDLATKHAMDSTDQFLGWLRLHDIPHGAGIEGALGVDHLIVHGEDQNQEVWVSRLDFLDQVDAISARQRDIDNHQIGLEMASGFDGLGAITRLTADHQIALQGKAVRKTLPQ
jgi:hypothetical protein